jgi:hypothetical protein
VFRLAPKAGIQIPAGLTDAEKLKFVQEKLEAGHEGAVRSGRAWAFTWDTPWPITPAFYDPTRAHPWVAAPPGLGGTLILDLEPKRAAG